MSRFESPVSLTLVAYHWRLYMSTLEPNSYLIRTKTAMPYDEAVARTKEALKSQGFGVLTEIDVKKTMKEKLDIDFRSYVIIGACNPPLAHAALTADVDIGALLPCNVIVYETDDGTVIAAQNPGIMLTAVNNPDLAPVAAEATEKLKMVIEELSPKE
jgi:uncharacterized protein (DUF302 family)